jgi:hypothetical protein
MRFVCTLDDRHATSVKNGGTRYLTTLRSGIADEGWLVDDQQLPSICSSVKRA